MAEHKGFDPSTNKRKKLRRQGNVIKSQLLTQSLAILAIFFSLFKCLSYLWINSTQVLEWCLSSPDGEHLGTCSVQIGSEMLLVIFITLGSGCLLALLSEFVQVRLEFLCEPLCPQFERLNPISGIRRITKGLGRSAMLFLKLLIVMLLAGYFTVDFLSLVRASLVSPGLGHGAGLLLQLNKVVYFCAGLLLIFGAADYLATRRRFMNDNSMSLDEVRREHKEDEGDPHVRSHRKALHEAMIMQELVKRVRSSKVIIVE